MTPATRTRPTAGRLRALLLDIVAERDTWLPTVEFDAASRWYRPLDVRRHLAADGLADDEVQAWLLSWLPGQRTGLHDHGGAAGGFVVAAGSLREHSVTAGRGPRRLLTVSRHAGQARMFDPRHIHEIVNVGREPAVSVHLYTPTLTTMTRYRWTRRGPQVSAIERAGADW